MTILKSSPNLGRQINLINGIQGVATGGAFSINVDVNQRIHRENFQCAGVAYVNPNCVISPPGAGGTQATCHATVLNGQITGFVVDNAGAGYTGLTPTLKITDEVYGVDLFGASGTPVLLAPALDSIGSITLVSGGTAGPVPVERFFTSFVHKVNGTVIRDIDADQILAIAAFSGMVPQIGTRRNKTFGLSSTAFGIPTPGQLPFQVLGSTGAAQMPLPYSLGQLPIYMSEPWRRITSHEEASSWDLAGQSTYQITGRISQGVYQPTLTGMLEFDFLRNQSRGNAARPAKAFLRPVKQHSYNFNVSAGQNTITTLPVEFPIQRLFFYGPSLPYYLEIDQDGNKVLEGSAEQINQMLRDYGFNTDVFDVAAVFDVNQRLHSALKVQKTLKVKVWATNADQLTIIEESSPPAFA